MEHRTDAELARIAYGRASTEHERQRARDAALELDRRERARAEAPTAVLATIDPADEADGIAHPRRRVLALVATSLLALLTIGLLAQWLSPRSSLEIFERPATEAEGELEQQLASFDPAATARFIGGADDARFFATLTSPAAPAAEPQLCIGIAEFGALTIIECLAVAEFETSGVDIEIPLSPETGGIRIGDGFRYTWGPTGDFRVERLPPPA